MMHTYYRIEFRAKSSISVGSGENAETDHDLMRHNNGKPYIPASSIAGVFRHYYCEYLMGEAAEKLFGTIEGGAVSSSLIFYDAELTGGYSETIRDSVKLKEKVAEEGAKFDMQVIESGACFVTYLELDKSHSEYTDAAENLLCAMKKGVLRFGHKTARGYGETEMIGVKRIQFDLNDPARLEAWLDFDLKNDYCWSKAEILSLDDHPLPGMHIALKLRQKGGLSIRAYCTDVSQNEDENAPDFKQMTLQNGVPVIPGTSWAGAFRERFRQLSNSAMTDELFGSLETHPSRILFSESQITDFTSKIVTRNSIDRFSAATKDAALYTESTCYSGETILHLMILLPKTERDTTEERTVLAAVLLDLHNGYLALGGLTSVGRGLFTIEQITVNGEDRTGLLTPEHVSELLEV